MVIMKDRYSVKFLKGLYDITPYDMKIQIQYDFTIYDIVGKRQGATAMLPHIMEMQGLNGDDTPSTLGYTSVSVPTRHQMMSDIE